MELPLKPKTNLYMKKIAVFIVAVSAICFSCSGPASKVTVENPKVEMTENPVGLGVAYPRFMWQISSPENNLIQQSYRIIVAGSEKDLKQEKNLLWDSGIVPSDNSLFIKYEGKALESNKDYYWRVSVNTNQGGSGWSKIRKWSTALLDNQQWKAEWIGENAMSNPGETDREFARLAARYLRKDFDADKKIKRAVLFISGLGSSESYINGKRISDDVFAPLPTFFPEKVYYNTYDVTPLVKKGKNTLGVILGNGRYFGMRNPRRNGFGLPSLLAQLEIEYTDGTKETILSDQSWKVTSQGPIVANNEFDGEEYDANMELGKWNQAGYDDSAWKTADLMPAPKGELKPQPSPNLGIMDKVNPIGISKLDDGRYILDMGQNMVGWLHVKLPGKKGQPVKMRFAETLKDNGELYMDNLRSAKVTDIYTPAADGIFSWEPSFIYHGFRFVEITGLEAQPELSAFTGKVVYDKMETIGTFETSNQTLNQVFKNAYWGIRGNYRGMPTDCPQRDERQGWLGDRAEGSHGESFVFDNNRLYNKWMQDIEDSQHENGAISDVSPKYWIVYNEDVTWPSAFHRINDMLYRQHGDPSAIARHYPSMRKWMKYVEETAMEDYIITRDAYGDWCMPPESQELIHSKDPSRLTAGPLLSTAVYYNLLQLMSKFAAMTGNDADIPGYQELSAKMLEAYNAGFFNPETAQYGNNTVTSNLISLKLGMVPQGYEAKVFRNIVDKTENDCKGHISTGLIGIQYLMRGLTEHGNVDLAYKLATNTTYPSWGYMIDNGATTIWELWNGNTADPGMNSGNHVMLLGDLLIWLYEDLAGIANDPQSTGFRKIRMSPNFPAGLDHVKASTKTVMGKIDSEWKREGDKFSWDVTIPGNTTATLRIPESMNVAEPSGAGILGVTRHDGYMFVETGSGKYRFESE